MLKLLRLFLIFTCAGYLFAAAPQITSTAVTTATEDSTYTYDVTVSDADNDKLNLKATTKPSWLSLTSDTTTSNANFVSGLNKTSFMYFDNATGDMYSTDPERRVAFVRRANGSVETVFGVENTEGNDNSHLDTPYACKIGPDGNIYITDSGTGNNRVIKLNSSWEYQGEVSIGEILGDITFDTNNNIAYVSGNTGIFRIDLNDFSAGAQEIYNTKVGNESDYEYRNFGLVIYNGYLYGARINNHTVVKYDLNNFGNGFEIVAGQDNLNGDTGDGGPAKNAKLDTPRSLTFDGFGNLYIADRNNGLVRQVDTDGIITTVTFPSAFTRVMSVDFYDGKIYVSNWDNDTTNNNSTIEEYQINYKLTGTPLNENVGTLNNEVTLEVDDGSSTSEQSFTINVENVNDAPTITSNPVVSATVGVKYSYNITASDDDGDLLNVTATTKPSWLSFSTTTEAEDRTFVSALNKSSFIYFDTNGDMYSTDPVDNIAFKRDVNGNVTTLFGEDGVSGSDNSHLDTPYACKKGPDGNIYITDSGNSRVVKLDSDGNFIDTLSLSDGISDIVFKDQNTAYVATTYKVVEIDLDSFTQSSVVLTNASLDNKIFGMAYSDPYLYGARIFDETVVRYKMDDANPQGTEYTVAGTSDNPGSSGDGGAATSALLHAPRSLSFDGFGNLYIADRDNSKVRKIDSSNQTISTVSFPFSFNKLMNVEFFDGKIYVSNWDNDNSNKNSTIEEYSLNYLLEGTPGATTDDKNVTLTVDDGSATDTQSFTINIVASNSAPTDIALSSTEVTENAGANADVGTLSSTDSDVGDTATYTLVNGTGADDNSDFTISGTSLKINQSPNFEEKSSYSIRIRVTDSADAYYEEAFTISVNNINDTPSNIKLDNTKINENNNIGALIANLSSDDEDTGDNHFYSLVSGDGDTDNGKFSISGSKLYIQESANYENKTSYSIRIRTMDDSFDVSTNTYSKKVLILVNNINDAPTISGTPSTSVNEDSAYSFTPSANDEDSADTLTFSITNKPSWASFSTSTGALTGTPTNSDVGTTSNIVISVTDGTETVSLSSFDLTVSNTNDAPTISGTPSTSVNEDSAYSFTPSANDEDSADTLTFSITNKPSWASFSTSTGALTGTPTNSDVETTSNIVISVSDGTETVSLSSFNLTVSNTNDAPTISGTPSTSVNEDSAYSFTPSANDVDTNDTLTFSITNKPSWASFSTTTGALTGTPTNSDVGTTSNIVISVTDGTETVSLSSFDLTVSNTNDAPTISGTPSTSVNEDSAYSFTPSANDEDSADTLTFSITNKPSWASFSTTTGALTGTPTNSDVGTTSNIVISVKDSSNVTASLSAFNLTVSNTNDAPTISGTPSTSVNEDSAYSFTPSANDVDTNDTLTFSITNKPSWASFSTTTGKLSGTPTNSDVGTTSNIVISVSDGTETVSLNSFDLTVSNTNDAPTSNNFTINTNEDTSYTFIKDEFNYTDVDGDILDHVQIITLPASGKLYNGNIELNVNDTISKSDLENLTFKFVPTTNENGNSYASFTYKVNDGIEYSSIYTVSIDVTAVNDKPIIVTNLTDEQKTEDFTTFTKDIELNDIDEDNLTLTATTNSDIITLSQGWNNPIALGDYDNSQVQTLTIDSVSNRFGTATVNVDVSDGILNDIKTFKVSVPAVLDFPNISSEVINLSEDFNSFDITLNNIDLGAQSSGTVTIVPSDTSIYNVPNPITITTADNGTKIITLTSKDNMFGDTTATITVDNQVDTPVSKTININVKPVNDAPTINGLASTGASQGVVYSFTPIANDVDTNDTLTFSITNKPSWASFSTTTGALTGTPTNSDVGTTSNIVISVTDGTETVSLSSFDLTVSNTNDAPTISGTPSTSVNEDSAYSFTPTANDVDTNDTLTFSITNKPSWASFSTSTGKLSGIPTNSDVGTTSNIVISVSDGTVTTSLNSFSIEVLVDTDKDGIPDVTDTDDDNDGIPDSQDADNDNDGISDIDEGINEVPARDSDKDGIPDYKDTDSDNDGISDVDEGTQDSDNDGIPDYKDSDTVGVKDSDNDGIPDSQDTDDDNDGISDIDEGINEVPVKDSDKDGIPDYKDTDSDNDGVSDIDEGTQDSDNDGIPDYKDSDTVGIKDSDNDGIPDSQDTDDDNDGISDIDEGINEVPVRDSDNDGIPDYKDGDSDNDGILDRLEENKDTDNDGIPDYIDEDSDNNGVPDSQEGDADTDNDGILDSIDPDDDNDGIPDSIEGNLDTDNDGIPNSKDDDSDGDGNLDSVEAALDDDLDGIPNYIDEDDSGSEQAIDNNDGTQTNTFKKATGSGDEKTSKFTTAIGKPVDITNNNDGTSDIVIYEPNANIKVKNDGGLDISIDEINGKHNITVTNSGYDLEITDPDNDMLISSPIYTNENGTTCQYDILIKYDGSDMITKHYLNKDTSNEVVTTVLMKIPNASLEINSNNEIVHTGEFTNGNNKDVKVTGIVSCDGRISTVTDLVGDNSSFVAVNKAGSTVVIDTNGDVDTTTSLEDSSNQANSLEGLNFKIDANTGGITASKVFKDKTTDQVTYTQAQTYLLGAKLTTTDIDINEVDVDLSNVRFVQVDVTDSLNNKISSTTQVDTSVDNSEIQRTSNGEDGQISTQVTIGGTTIVVNNKLDGKIQHIVTSNGKTTQATSSLEGANTSVDSTGVTTTYDDSNNSGVKTEVITNSSAQTEHKLEKDGVITQATSQLAGAKTKILKDENNKPKITTNVETSNTNNQLVQIEVDANSDGSAVHKLLINGKEIKATSQIIGANTTIKSNGQIETNATFDNNTSSKVVANPDGSAVHEVVGDGFDTKATFAIFGAKTTIKDSKEVETILSVKESMCLTNTKYVIVNVITDAEGRTVTKFDKYSCSDDSFIETIDIFTNQSFEPDNKVEVKQNNGVVEISTKTKINESIQF